MNGATYTPPAVNKWVVAAAIGWGSLMATIDSSIVNVAVPVIRGQMGVSIQEITWISTAYMIAMVVVMPMTGFLGALFGQKRVYLASLILFVIGSMLCGTARSLEALVLFRIVQGIGGGSLQPTQQAILRQTFPPEEQGMAMAMYAMVIMIGPAVGPVLGGWIIDNYSWPWIFYVNLPVGAAGIFMTMRFVHEPPDVREANRVRADKQRKNLDWIGIALMTVGVGALQYLFEEGPRNDWFASDVMVVIGFVTLFALVAFVIRELSAPAPVVNLRLFKDPTFAAGTVIGLVMFAMLMGNMFLLPVFMQELQGMTATTSGWALMPRTLAMMVASPIVGRLYNRLGAGVIVGAGVLLFFWGSWDLGLITTDTSITGLIVPQAITGLAFACLFIPLTTAALSQIPRPLLADAAGLNSFLRQIGGSVGLTIIATVYSTDAIRASDGLRRHLSPLRPEVTARLGQLKDAFMHRGLDAAHAAAAAGHAIGVDVGRQSATIAFDRNFMMRAVAFLGILPFLYLLRKPKGKSAGDGPPTATVHLE